MNTRKWLVSTINYYRKLGFFKEYSSLSNDRVADILEKVQKKNSFDGGIFKSQREEDILALDETRTIPFTLEDISYAPFSHKDNIKNPDLSWKQQQALFNKLLFELSNISRGIFKPKRIKYLSYNDGLVVFTFTLFETKHLLQLEPIDDPSLLAHRINPLIKNINYQFELWNIAGELFLLMLNFEEKQKLITEKKWRFSELNSEYISQNTENNHNLLVDVGVNKTTIMQLKLYPCKST